MRIAGHTVLAGEAPGTLVKVARRCDARRIGLGEVTPQEGLEKRFAGVVARIRVVGNKQADAALWNELHEGMEPDGVAAMADNAQAVPLLFHEAVADRAGLGIGLKQ